MPTTPVAYNSLGAVIGIAVLGSLVVALWRCLLAIVIGRKAKNIIIWRWRIAAAVWMAANM